MYKNFDWTKESCYDQKYEIFFFDRLIGFIDNIILPNRIWEEKIKLNEKENKYCSKYNNICKTDIYHSGTDYKQYVLGRTKDTKCFIKCKNYEILNIKEWSIKNNDIFIKYITSDQKKQKININLPVCEIFPIRIYVQNSNIVGHILETKNIKKKKFDTKELPGSITSRELCILVHMKYNLYGIKKNNNEYENFILCTNKKMNYIEKWYKKKNIKLPNFIKI